MTFITTHRSKFGNAPIDLVLYATFKGAEKLCGKIEASGIFTNTVYYDRPVYPERHRVLRHVMNCLFNYRKSSERFYKLYPTMRETWYDRFIMCLPYDFAYQARSFCADRKLQTVLCDEGAGSHNGASVYAAGLLDQIAQENNPAVTPAMRRKQLKKRLVNFLTNSAFTFNTTDLFVFNLNKSTSDNYRDITLHNLPAVSGENRALLKEIFPTEESESLYREASAVFLGSKEKLTPTNDDLRVYENCIHSICAAFPNNKFVYRPHPMGIVPSTLPSNLVIDSYNQSWELLVSSDAITNNTLLISIGSTSQLLPKMLAEKEPGLAFIASALPSSRSFPRILETARQAKNAYLNKNAVCIANSYEDFFSFCANWISTSSLQVPT